MKVLTETQGVPRMGKQREVKLALEAFWGGKSDGATGQIVEEVEAAIWKTQLKAGIDSRKGAPSRHRIGIGDASLYDLVLDWTVRLGIIPDRFRDLSGLNRHFAMARGRDGIPALEMTKWFDTNYHYLVPEMGETLQPLDFSDFLATVRRSQTIMGELIVPIVLGPLTLLRLSRLDLDLEQAAAKLRDRYVILLQELKNLGVVEIQIHEPALVLDDAENFKALYQSIYTTLAEVELPIHLVKYFDNLGKNYPWVTELRVAAISLDSTRDKPPVTLESHWHLNSAQ